LPEVKVLKTPVNDPFELSLKIVGSGANFIRIILGFSFLLPVQVVGY